MSDAGLQPGTYFTRSFISQEIFFALGTPIFSNTRECLLFIFLLQCVKQEFTLFFTLFLQKTRRHVLVSCWLLLIVIDKFTILEFTPFYLVTKGALSLSGRFACVSRTIVLSFLLFHAVFFLTISLKFGLVVATYFADQINLHF